MLTLLQWLPLRQSEGADSACADAVLSSDSQGSHTENIVVEEWDGKSAEGVGFLTSPNGGVWSSSFVTRKAFFFSR